MSRSGEFELIANYLAPLAGPNSFELKDDAALLQPKSGFDWIITQDAIAETVHFFGDEAPERIAQKALRVNVSDIVAKGGRPEHYSLALGVPKNWGDTEFASFAKGLAHDQALYGLKLTGGDTYSSPDRLHVSITMLGAVPTGCYVSRMGAKPGDKVFVSGTIGNSAAHLWFKSNDNVKLLTSDVAYFRNSYELPEPPIGLETVIREFASASMDVSDGLLGDLQKLVEASGVSATVERDQIPLSPQLESHINQSPELWDCVLGGGDDYQCLFTVDPTLVEEFQRVTSTKNIQITAIGEITGESGSDVSLTVNGVPLSQSVKSYRHF